MSKVALDMAKVAQDAAEVAQDRAKVKEDLDKNLGERITDEVFMASKVVKELEAKALESGTPIKLPDTARYLIYSTITAS